MIPALTVRQPWAWLLAAKRKKYEVRTRGFSRLGGKIVAVHAGLEYDQEATCIIAGVDPDTASELWLVGPTLPRGAVVAVGRVDKVFRVVKPEIPLRLKYEREALCGVDDRWLHHFDRMIELAETIPATGKQGLWGWDLPGPVEKRLRAAGML